MKNTRVVVFYGNFESGHFQELIVNALKHYLGGKPMEVIYNEVDEVIADYVRDYHPELNKRDAFRQFITLRETFMQGFSKISKDFVDEREGLSALGDNLTVTPIKNNDIACLFDIRGNTDGK